MERPKGQFELDPDGTVRELLLEMANRKMDHVVMKLGLVECHLTITSQGRSPGLTEVIGHYLKGG